jgi:hypothetical protein
VVGLLVQKELLKDNKKNIRKGDASFGPFLRMDFLEVVNMKNMMQSRTSAI